MKQHLWASDNGASGPPDVHVQTRFRGWHGVSVHPLQRAGLVASDSHEWAPSQGAWARAALGDTRVAVSRDLGLTIAYGVPGQSGNPRDPRFMV